jgi:predicted Fe-Mo cluster-binding NifX family protein
MEKLRKKNEYKLTNGGVSVHPAASPKTLNRLLQDAGVRELITAGTLTPAHIEAIKTYPASKALQNEGVRALISAGTLTPAHIAAIKTNTARDALWDAEVHELITAGTLTPAHIAAIKTNAASRALRDAGVRALITEGTLTIEQVLRLTDPASKALRNAGVRALITEGTLTPAHIAAITTYSARDALQDADIRALITEGTLTPAHIAAIKTYDKRDLLKNKGVRTLITAGTLTPAHIAAIKTNTASAALQDAGVHELITAGTLTPAHIAAIKTNAASAALQDAGVRALITEGTLTIEQVLKLTDAASEALRDPDTQQLLRIRFITKETASLKLPIVVREEAMRYMKPLSDPNTAEDLRAFTRLIAQVKEDGVEMIWDQIKGNVADRMFDEFGSLYRGRADYSFTGLIDAGQYTELPDLSIFQESIQNSEGYRQYCSQILRRSGMFSSPRKSAESANMQRIPHGNTASSAKRACKAESHSMDDI